MRIALLESFNPFAKVVAILISCVILALTSSWKFNLAVFAVVMVALIFLSKCNLKTLFGMIIPICLLATAIFISGVISGKNSGVDVDIYQITSVSSALMLATRILGYVSLGIIFALSTDQTLFIMSLMHQAHVKPKFAYGVLAAYNLIPTLRREWDEVNLAYRARQKSTGLIPFGPLFNTLVNGIRWSENVAMAMESKGFDGEGDRTYAIVTKVTAKDFIFGIVCIALMVLGMLFLK